MTEDKKLPQNRMGPAPAPDEGTGASPPIAERAEATDIWPRDLNAGLPDEPTWGRDPEVLRGL